MPVKAPFVPQDIEQKRFTAAARFSVGAVVGSHNDLHAALRNARFELRQICIPKIVSVGNGVELVSQTLGTAVYGIVLGAGGGFERFAVGSLKPFNESHAHPRCEIRVFAVCLMSASPARITENIYVGRPECKPFVYIMIALLLVRAVFGASFVADDAGCLVYQFGIECCRQPYSLRENGGDA
jgi:hypothetical protein